MDPTLAASGRADGTKGAVVSFRDVHLAFDRPILRGVSFELPAGSTRVILGGSGSGKTTILRLILGLLRAQQGAIEVQGVEVSPLDEDELRDVRLAVGMVFQEGALFDSLTVGENVGYQLREQGWLPPDEIEARVREMLGYVGLADFFGKAPSDLSGGQRRRVAVARALASRPSIMLYDEPTTGLDPITAKTITDLIVKVRDLHGVSSILVTHQLRDAFNVARTHVRLEDGEPVYDTVDLEKADGARFLMLREGRLLFEGTANELLTSENPYLREFLA